MVKPKPCFIPRKFLLKYPLRIGSLVFGIIMTVIMAICIVSTSVQFSQLDWKVSAMTNAERNTYGLVMMSILYSIFMFCVCLWFLWGWKQNKSSVVIGFVAVATLWLLLTFCLLIILICLYSWKVNLITYIICFILGLLAIGVLGYGLVVTIGYWYELKEVNRQDHYDNQN